MIGRHVTSKTRNLSVLLLDISSKYKPTADNISLLSDKVIKGGSGVWGDVAMAPHPGIGLPEAKQIVQYIL